MPKTEYAGRRHRLLFVLSFLAVASAVTAVMMSRHMDVDSYYMIPLGREILEDGIPRTYAPSYYPGMRLVAQQWLYAVLAYLASLVPNELGLMAFHMAQVLILYALCYRYLKPAYGDPFWCWLGATACMLQLGDFAYQASLRPENATLALLLGTMLAMDDYDKSGKKPWLLLPPVLLLLEMQLHMTMWPLHFCVMAAYLAPFPEKLASKIPGRPVPARAMPDRWQLLSLATMAPVLLMQPYGLDGAAYLFRSMPAFGAIGVSEQQPLMLVEEQSLTVIAVGIMSVWLAFRHAIRMDELCLAIGIGLLGCANYHSGMFLPLALLALARPLLRMLAARDPSPAAESVPDGVKKLCAGIAAAAVAISAMACAAYAPGFRDWYGIGPAIGYIQDRGSGGNVLAETDAGSVLYYNGFAGRVMGDSRHEAMSKDVNGSTDGLKYLAWFMDGTDPDGEAPDIRGYLDRYDIDCVLLAEDRRAYSYLWGWLDGSGEWEKADHAASDDWAVWVRKGET